MLRSVLKDAARSHWSAAVRDRARDVLQLLPPVAAKQAKPRRTDDWMRVRDTARARDPRADFENHRGPRK
jgi:hypothetical protein